MTRICIIGDSHTGALKRASRSQADDRGLQMTFFAGHVELMRSVHTVDRALVPRSRQLQKAFARTSGGEESVAVDAYDRFVVVGLQFGLRRLAGLYRNFVSDSMVNREDGKYLLSDDCFVRAAKAPTADCEAMRIARMIRALTDKPIFVVPMPNYAAGVAETELPMHVGVLYAAARNGDADAIGRLFATLCGLLSRDAGIHVISPLAEVAESGIFNQRKFSMLPEDMGQLSRQKKLGLMAHGNESYGAQVLRAVQAAARSAPEEAALPAT